MAPGPGLPLRRPLCTGAAALLMEWGIVRGQDPSLVWRKGQSLFKKRSQAAFRGSLSKSGDRFRLPVPGGQFSCVKQKISVAKENCRGYTNTANNHLLTQLYDYIYWVYRHDIMPLRICLNPEITVSVHWKQIIYRRRRKMLKTLKNLAGYYKPYKALFFSDMFFAMLGAVITLAIPLLVRYITGTVVNFPLNEATRTIFQLGAAMIAMVLVEAFCNYYIAYYGHMMGAKIEYDMRNEIFGHYQKLSFAFFDNQKVGHLLSRITSDLFDITELLHHGPEDVVISVIKLFGAFIILLMINGKLALVAIGIVALMLLYAIFLNRRMKSAFKENRARIADINSQIEDSLSGIRVVKSFSNEAAEMDKFRRGNDRFVAAKRKTYRYMGVYNSGMGAFATLITVCSLIMGAFLMTTGELTSADLVTFLLYINNFTEPVKKLVNFTEQFQNGYSGYERFLEIMNIAPDIKDKPDAVHLDHVRGDIQFDDVSFHYEGKEENVLSHVNLKVKAGEYVALVGSSGAGKTTLCSLIPGFTM